MSDENDKLTSCLAHLLLLVLGIIDSSLRILLMWKMYVGWFALPTPSYAHSLAFSSVLGYLVVHSLSSVPKSTKDEDYFEAFFGKMFIMWFVVGIAAIVRLCIGAGPYVHVEAL